MPIIDIKPAAADDLERLAPDYLTSHTARVHWLIDTSRAYWLAGEELRPRDKAAPEMAPKADDQ